MDNQVLEAIKNRRTVARYENTAVKDGEVSAILEAGRWAPSWINKQPWNFIVIRDQKTKEQLGEVVPTTFVQSLKEAPVCVAVVVDTEEDPYHFIEAGAAAVQNMTLAAYSLGLNTSWIGVFDAKEQKNAAEDKVKKILEVPKKHRVVALLPVGHAKGDVPKKDRKALSQIMFKEKFGKR
ncbi:nitroreductase family protein [Candidatus Bathyarchaeota archaeon]|jgi:nitroreductase|nr:nitroreductase family protein [Candidatus Bathyarchaeota archaeon]